MAPAAVGVAVAVGLAYAVGTFPTAELVGRAHGKDVAGEGSGNPGASNVYRLAGRRAGLSVFLGDFLKGLLATGAGYVIGGRNLALACGAAAVVGHCFPVTRRFRGGKGVATAAGFISVIEPLIGLVGALVWIAVAKGVRKASVASLVIAVGIPTAVALVRGLVWETAAVTAVALLIVGRHADNVARLMRGEERTLR
jgi:glycerol-3-phosphate acyltransferase PlsY